MEGLAGLLRLDGQAPEKDAVHRMFAAMPHRAAGGVAMAASGGCLLAVGNAKSDPDETGLRLFDEGNSILCLHGRADNWETLRRDLLPSVESPPDVDLFLAAYQRWGEACLEHVDGEFALAIWDGPRQRLMLARDRVGLRPLHFHLGPDGLSFASDVSALLALQSGSPQLDDDVVAQHLRLDVVAGEETLWRGIKCVRPAFRLMYKGGIAQSTQYWDPLDAPEIRYKRRADYEEHYRAMLFDVVRRASRSDRPVAFEVSGGLDSSALFAVADQLEKSGRLMAPGLFGVSLGFDAGGDADERHYVEAVARHLGRSVEFVPWERWSLEECEAYTRHHRIPPPYPNGIMNQADMRYAASRGAGVLVNGVGGDEFVGGSLRSHEQAVVRGDLAQLVRLFRDEATQDGLASAANAVFWQGIRPFFPIGLRNIPRRLAGRQPLMPRNVRYLSEAMRTRGRASHPRASASRLKRAPVLSELLDSVSEMSAGTSGSNQELLGAVSGVEKRSPFFAREMIEFAFGTDPALRRSGSLDKRLHRAALKGLLPDEVLNRRSRATFGDTFAPYTRLMAERQGWKQTALERGWGTTDSIERLAQDGRCLDGFNQGGWVIWNMFFLALLAREGSDCADLIPDQDRVSFLSG